MMKIQKEKTVQKSKLRTLGEGLLIAFVVFVVCFFFLMSYVNSRFNDFYWSGYRQGKETCAVIDRLKIYDSPTGIDVGENIKNSLNYSLNFS